MPYKRRYKKRQRGPRNAASKAMRMVRNLSKKVQGEVKKHAIVNTAKPVSTLNPITQSFSDLQAGDAYNEREGLSVRWKYISMKYNVTHDSSVQTSSLRFMIVQDLRQELSTLPTASQVLLNPANIHSPLHPQYVGKFKVHMDKIVWTNALTRTRVEGKFYKRVLIPAKWFDTSATTYTKNGIYLIVLTDAPLASSSTLSYFTQMGFYDN